ncbi:hypothetical protein OUZ56_020921 [Daphnia magna]|uniref:Uncharacterized protein n=1 Tax=Daphnia magna TaxID=35525 RepID=A0ABQ9ZFZ9_9CRUS|nr:hypothetical protein OUZ56_020921 [Daphnia magna]
MASKCVFTEKRKPIVGTLISGIIPVQLHTCQSCPVGSMSLKLHMEINTSGYPELFQYKPTLPLSANNNGVPLRK